MGTELDAARANRKSELKRDTARTSELLTLASGEVVNARQSDLVALRFTVEWMERRARETVSFRLANGSSVTASKGRLEEIGFEILDALMERASARWDAEKQIDAAATVEAVNAVVW